jgi:hypothetical protein
MLTSLLALAALGIVLLLGNRLLRRRGPPARAHVPRTDGVVVMRPPRRYGIALGISALFPAGVLAAIAVRALSAQETSVFDAVAVVVATAAALAVAAHQFTAAFRSRFVVDEVGLTRVGVLGRRSVRWGDVSRVVFNPMNRWFFVTGAGGERVWVPVDLHGIGDFAAVALAKLPAAALRADELAREALEDLAAAEGSQAV